MPKRRFDRTPHELTARRKKRRKPKPKPELLPPSRKIQLDVCFCSKKENDAKKGKENIKAKTGEQAAVDDEDCKIAPDLKASRITGESESSDFEIVVPHLSASPSRSPSPCH